MVIDTFDVSKHAQCSNPPSSTSVMWWVFANSVGLFPAALGPNFLDTGVGTGPTATQFGPACAQTMPCLPGMCLRQAELFQISCGK